MPELPEVETVRASLEALALGERVTSVTIRRCDLRFPVPQAAIEAALPGARLARVGRRGKLLILDFEGVERAHLLVHLGMSGRMLASQGEPAGYGKHEHLRIGLETRQLRFIDPRRFGSVELARPAELEAHPRLRNIGVEPLSAAFDGALMFEATRGRRQGIRDWFLVGGVVAGVGNIYANEACFRAGVRPQRPVGRLSRSDCERLVAQAKAVLAEAIEAGGSSLSRGGYVDGEGKPGWFRVHHAVYLRDGQPCQACGETIKRVPKLKRGAFYCPRCQPR